MTLSDNLKSAVRVLAHNRVRTFLTMLGIIIGIAAFIIVNSVGAGAQSLILNQVRRIGTDIVAVLPGASDEDQPPAAAFGINVTTLKIEDAEAILKNVNTVAAVAPVVRGAEVISYEGERLASTFIGTSPSFVEIQDTEVESGRFISDEDIRSNARVVVLGAEIKNKIFGEDDALDKQITLQSGKYTVVGVMAQRGATIFENFDELFFVPYSTAQKVMLGIRYLNGMNIKVIGSENIEQVREDVRVLLRQRHKISDPSDDDFSVRSIAQAMDILTSVTNALKLFLTAIAAMSLLVGGIGIMSIMYVAVSERTYEIGLRKAIGAKNKEILLQFLTEAVVITVIAGIFGTIGGVLISFLISIVVNALGYDWSFIVTPQSLLLAFFISVLIGLVFGLYPARRAAKKTPVQALTYD